MKLSYELYLFIFRELHGFQTCIRIQAEVDDGLIVTKWSVTPYWPHAKSRINVSMPIYFGVQRIRRSYDRRFVFIAALSVPCCECHPSKSPIFVQIEVLNGMHKLGRPTPKLVTAICLLEGWIE